LKKLFFVVVALVALFLIVGLVSGLYFIYMSDTDIKKEEAKYIVSASKLFHEFEKNEAQANKKYMDQIIEVNGEISEIEEDYRGAKVITLKTNDPFNGVLCTLREDQSNAISPFNIGNKIIIKGVSTGMLMDVVLNKCVIVNQEVRKAFSEVKSDFILTSNKLFNEFKKNEKEANKKYLDRIIQVDGNIAEISKDQKGAMVVTLRNNDAFSGVLCTLQEDETKALTNYKVNQPIKIRGVCTGMLMDVVLNKCVIIE